MIVLLTTADTEILAAEEARARLPDGFPAVAAANPTRAADPATFVDDLLAAAPQAVVIRLLGGRRAWPDGFDRLAAGCADRGVPLLALSGTAEADAELTAASTAPAGIIADAFEYLGQGGVGNTANLLRFVADTLLATGFGFDPPEVLPEHGEWHPDGDARREADGDEPVVGLVFYRSHWAAGNTDFVAALARAVETAGAVCRPVFCASLRPDADGRVPALERLDGAVDAIITTVLASGGSGAADLDDDAEAAWAVPAVEALGVPLVQAIGATSAREAWAASDQGLSPLDAAMQVAIPEFDGRLISVPVSFKEQPAPAGDGPWSSEAAPRYVPDPERCTQAAGLAVRLARLRRTPPVRRRVAVVLSNYPTKHSRIGNGVGLDTPASAVALLDALTAAGYDTGWWAQAPLEPDALIHRLIAAGGFDAEFLTDDQLAADPHRYDGQAWAGRFAQLPEALREAVEAHWGPPPGQVLVHARADAPRGHPGDLCFAALELGNVLLAVQPPRGFGESTAAIYHDPDLPPTHHYLAFYRWLDEQWGCHALVHLGKHGTLEWLPGKSLGLSAACAPDAALGDVPLVYPFVVNDPGEGTQAKRRAHACIVDHLVPPMTRAETYDELARLEDLLEEYDHVSAMDPGKQRALHGEIWQLLRTAELARDLGWSDADADEAPVDLDDRLAEVDGYLCELKDRQIRGGLHVLGRPPEQQALVDLVLAVLRLPQHRPARHGQPARQLPGLRAAVGAVFDLDEAALLAAPGALVTAGPDALVTAAPDALVTAAPDALVERFPGPASRASDLVDRLEDASEALVAAMAAKGWQPDAATAVVADHLGDQAADGATERLDEVAEVLAFAATDVVPRLQATAGELDRVGDALAGRYVPAGPSGSPTRGRIDVLPTGKNFYSVDPKALPTPLAWQVGQRLADDLVARYVDEEGEPPAQVGIVVWGTAAMRTHGDDVAEILALLGVRPVWHPQSRRVTGLELIDAAELGRPRVDVTVRISGFFRDAFPNLVRLIDDAVTLAAGADTEPAATNPIAAAVARDADALAAADGLTPEAARRRASARVFGSKPGSYGAGLLPLIDARSWHSDADLAEVYATWGGYAYGRGLDGTAARSDMQRVFARTQVAVKNIDTREHDLLDSDDYFQFHGGMVAQIRALTGANPKAYIGDSADPARVRTHDLAGETARVFRARVANPKWIDAMRAHGYKGAFELAATTDYLFGYDATAGVVPDWMYATLADRYVFDDDVRAFMTASNPWALRAIAERLLEAADRGLWVEPDADRLEGLRAVYLALEGDLEDAAAQPSPHAREPRR